MFGTLGWMEIAIIAIIALLIVGPRGLPKLGRSLGRALGNFKREARELKLSLIHISEPTRPY